MKATAKQVAHAAGVSLSAVSRAFKPGSPLDEDKKKRILAVASEIGYVSPARRTAEAIAAGTVSLVAGDLLNPFYPMVLETLALQLQATNRQLLVYALPSQTDVDAIIPQILAARPSGIIVTSAKLTSLMAGACREEGIRVVLFNRTQPDFNLHTVSCDNYAGGRDIARYLLERGHREIAFIGGLPDTSTHVERSRGFRDCLRETGISLAAEGQGLFAYHGAYEDASRLLSARKRPSAIFCCNDIMAIAAIDAAREKGLNVPGDVAIVGFDDIPMAAWNAYKLTTIRQPVERMIEEALELIVRSSDADDDGSARTIRGKLIERASG